MREKLKELRLKYGYTQDDVAKRIHKSRSSYTMYEKGTATPPYHIVLKLKSLFNYYGDDLFENKEKN